MNATREARTHNRSIGRRLAVAVGAAALAAPLAMSGLAYAASAPPPPTPTQRAEAIAAPSIVYVGVQWKGWVQLNGTVAIDGTMTLTGWHGPFTVNTACSGYVADQTGYVVTAGHCVDNQSMIYGGKALIIDALINYIHNRFPQLTSVQLEKVRTALVENGKVEGRSSGSPPIRTVTVYPAGLTPVAGVVANTVDFKGLAEGDVALLKINPTTPLPALTVAPAQPAIGTSILLAGYPGSVSTLVDAGQQPSFKDGQTSSQQTIEGVPFTEVSAAATAGMSGGPAVDMQGRVIGTVSFRPGTETAAFNFVTATSTIRSLLSRNGVPMTLNATDRAYRTGLTAYFAGRYHDAVKALDQVLAIEPNHVLALQYKRLSIQNYPNEVSTGGGGNTMLFVGIGAGAAVILAVVATLLLLRRRKGGAPPVFEVPITAPTPTPAQPQPEAATPAPPVAPTTAEPVATSGFCPNCGAAHAPDAHFCESCGQRFKVPVAAQRGQWDGKA